MRLMNRRANRGGAIRKNRRGEPLREEMGASDRQVSKVEVNWNVGWRKQGTFSIWTNRAQYRDVSYVATAGKMVTERGFDRIQENPSALGQRRLRMGRDFPLPSARQVYLVRECDIAAWDRTGQP